MTDINFLEELFYSTELWGFLGPAAIVFIGWYASKKDKNLGGFWFILELIMIATFYAPLLPTHGVYLYHMLIILVGGILTCLLPWAQR